MHINRSVLAPVLDSFRFESTDFSLDKKFIENNYSVETRINKSIAKDQEIKVNPKMEGDSLLIYYGITLENNEEHDCFSLSLTFSERKDDKLASQRSKFFSKYFLYDRNHFDVIEECLKLSKPFDRRVLFYYYVLMMDANDMEKEDPKRNKLEEDKLIVNYAKENFIAMEKLSKTSLAEEEERYNKETNPLIKHFIKYKIQQRLLLTKIIEVYEDQYNFLVKDESL
jgi:hypothetical protein